MIIPDIQNRKSELRREAAQKLKSLGNGQISIQSGRIAGRLFQMEAYRRAGVIYAYASTALEAGTDEILSDALALGKQVFLPRVINDEEMEFLRIRSMEDIREAGPFGIREPAGTAEADLSRRAVPPVMPDLILVPGLLFDKKKRRLGRGRAYYDRFLKEYKGKCPLAALALSCQITEQVPVREWDIPMDYIVTPDEVF